jgi:hypothetical protein
LVITWEGYYDTKYLSGQVRAVISVSLDLPMLERSGQVVFAASWHTIPWRIVKERKFASFFIYGIGLIGPRRPTGVGIARPEGSSQNQSALS